ncbi:MAG: hypothetical protein M1830_001422 [Pleopsidium flavum]|nr:MAG: hypothetical protein M1830_001422 [Pleopsidium flavum]
MSFVWSKLAGGFDGATSQRKPRSRGSIFSIFSRASDEQGDSSVSTPRTSLETDPGSFLSSKTSVSNASNQIHRNGPMDSNQKRGWFARRVSPILGLGRSAQRGPESEASSSLNKVKPRKASYSEHIRTKISQVFEGSKKSEGSGTGRQKLTKRLMENPIIFSDSYRMRHDQQDWSDSVLEMQPISRIDLPYKLDVHISTSPLMPPQLDGETPEHLSIAWTTRHQWPAPSLVAMQQYIAPMEDPRKDCGQSPAVEGGVMPNDGITAEEREFLATYEAAMASVKKAFGRQVRPSKATRVVKALVGAEYALKGRLPTPASRW